MGLRELTIADRRIADDELPFVVAEIGHNHGGSLELCKQMFRVAAQCGCDAVKLQKRENGTLYTRDYYEQSYHSEHSYGPTYGEHRDALEFGWAEYQELRQYAKELGLIFFATAFDIPSADFLAHLGMPAIKIASGDLTNHPLLKHCASLGVPLIVSTGGHSIIDVDAAVVVLERSDAQFALLQATAAYPCPHEELNLRVIETYRQRYPNIVIGLSDHQDGISMAPVAWMLGARIFEKHFTLSRAARGSDNHFSLEPEPMRRMVNDLRGVKAALGDGVKRQYESEKPAMVKMGKALYAVRDLSFWHRVEQDDIGIKSPGGAGIAPDKLAFVHGRRLLRSLAADELIEWDYLGLKEIEQEAVCSSSMHL